MNASGFCRIARKRSRLSSYDDYRGALPRKTALLRKIELDFVVTSRRVSTGYAIEGLTILAHLDPFLKDALLAGFKALIDLR
jgi:hypothetical protein